MPYCRSSPQTDADFECQFSYQPEPDAAKSDQIGLFDGMACRCRVFVSNISIQKWCPAGVVAFYNKRAAVENLIKEYNHDIGLTAHPPEQWGRNAIQFQLSVIAFNLNCWLESFQRDESVTMSELRHRTVVATRLLLVSLAAKIERHGGQTEIHFGLQYQELDRFDQLMTRLRSIERKMDGFIAVVDTPLRAESVMYGVPARRKTALKSALSKVKTLLRTPINTRLRAANGAPGAKALPAVHNSNRSSQPCRSLGWRAATGAFTACERDENLCVKTKRPSKITARKPRCCDYSVKSPSRDSSNVPTPGAARRGIEPPRPASLNLPSHRKPTPPFSSFALEPNTIPQPNRERQRAVRSQGEKIKLTLLTR